jgi:penicillin-binding protein 2
VTCAPLPSGGSGYRDLRCWNTSGHGALDLSGALVQSCNAYFAWLGETLSTAELVELCDMFGFGAPTGVRRAPDWDDGARRRSGLREDVAGLALARAGGKLGDADRMRVANGLGRIEATPMQVARGMLALARGELVELRLASRVGERALPLGASVPLALKPYTLDFVRRAMRGVADDARGTAHKALSLDQVGLTVAVKTGSADLVGRSEGKVRKHAWVAGWVPARDPKLVFVVFEHDTRETSSHGAVFLARQLLRQPEVLAYLSEQGVDISGALERGALER